jgi:hypothetical protein
LGTEGIASFRAFFMEKLYTDTNATYVLVKKILPPLHPESLLGEVNIEDVSQRIIL